MSFPKHPPRRPRKARHRRALTGVVLRMAIGTALIGAYFLFDLLYCLRIAPANAYLGFVCRPANGYFSLLSLSFAVMPMAFLPVRFQRPSDWAVAMLYLFSYYPTALMVRHVLDETAAFALLFLLLVSLAVLTSVRLLYPRAVPLRSFRLPSYLIAPEKRTTRVAFLVLAVVLALLYMWQAGFRLSIDLANIYERRLAARASTGRVLGYMISIGRSVLPVVMLYLFFATRRTVYLLLLAVPSLAIFSYDGTKTALLIPLFLGGVGYLAQGRNSLRRSLIYLIPLGALVGAALEEAFWSSGILRTYFVRRMFAVPGFLNGVYFDFFSTYPKVLLTDSIARAFLPPVYPVPTTFLIGSTYFLETTNANTGIWMGWFAHFGVPGTLMVSVLAALVLRAIDLLAQGRALLGILSCTYIGILWSEQMFHTSFLSGGVFYLLVVLLYFHHRGQRSGRTHPYRPEQLLQGAS